MTTYFDHNDSKGLTVRRVAAASNADRKRMLATLQERDMGCITLYMPAHAVRDKLEQAKLVRAYALVGCTNPESCGER
jgi:hypothetical protein